MSYIIDFGEEKKYIYGVSFDNTNTVGTRIYSSSKLQFTPSNTTTAGRDDFISIKDSPFHIRDVILSYDSGTGKQKLSATEEDSDWNTKKDSFNRMIEFPKFYYKRPNANTFLVSSYCYNGFKPSPMHYRNGTMYDHVYISKYKLYLDPTSGNLNSKTGQTIVSQSGSKSDGTGYCLNWYRTKLRSEGMYVFDYATYCSLAMLMLVKYARLNLQPYIGIGWVNGDINGNSSNDISKIKTTGTADSIKGKDGYGGSTAMTNGPMVAFGIENFWENVGTFVDGVVRNGTKVYINTDIENLSSGLGDKKLIGTSTYNHTENEAREITNLSQISYDSTYDWALFPTSTVSMINSDINVYPNTYQIEDSVFCQDNSDTGGTIDKGLVFGRHTAAGRTAGLFSLDWCLPAFTTSRTDFCANAICFI